MAAFPAADASRPLHCRKRTELKDERLAPAPSNATASRRHGGTIGAGTRPGKPAAELQHIALIGKWDLDGWQLASLSAAKIVFQNPGAKLSLCHSGGMHPPQDPEIRILKGPDSDTLPKKIEPQNFWGSLPRYKHFLVAHERRGDGI